MLGMMIILYVQIFIGVPVLYLYDSRWSIDWFFFLLFQFFSYFYLLKKYILFKVYASSLSQLMRSTNYKGAETYT